MSDRVEQFLNRYGEKLLIALDKALPRTTDATGNLRESLRFTIKRLGQSYHFELLLADYYEAVDRGQKPGTKVPVSSLFKWIKDKRLVMHPTRGLSVKTQGSRLKKVSEDAVLRKRLAFAIQRKIFNKGTKGTFFFTDTIPDWANELKRNLLLEFKGQMIAELRTEIPLQTKIKF